MAKRKFNTTSVVIVCEGNETEVPYFEELIKYAGDIFSVVKVVPNSAILKELAEEKKDLQRKKRAFEKANPGEKYPEGYYWELKEGPNVDYSQYSSQPTRYVREAQLYLHPENGAYAEAWAVFDQDFNPNVPEEKSLEQAFGEADRMQNLHIAFSSYCFEEWLLLHFERNKTPFSNSICKEYSDAMSAEKKKNSGKHITCNCGTCIGGYLSNRKFIPNYDKSRGSEYFKKYTYKGQQLCKRALVNAAWTRSLSTEPVYERNPYCDVDILVKHLLGQDQLQITWHRINEPFLLDGEEFVLCEVECQYFLHYNGSNTHVIQSNYIFWCDNDYKSITTACLGHSFIFSSDKPDNALKLSGESKVLCIQTNGEELYFDFD